MTVESSGAEGRTRLVAKYNTVFQRLVDSYGRPQWEQHQPPVDELVCTILSQSTSDTNRDRGFAALKERFPDWRAVMNAPEDQLIDTIRPAGLANQKAPRIQAALRTIYEQQGTISLDFLAEMPLKEAKEWLTQLKGVGPKTAAILLLFTFHKPAFPVDTHVYRITRRLGLIAARVTANKAHDILEDLGDPETFYPFHINLIRHGREVCRARVPNCAICPLQEDCDYYQALLTGAMEPTVP
jgi:endonuclease-3